MHQRDWILRVIEQLGAALAELRRRIVGGERSAVTRKALTDLAGQAGYDLGLLRSFDLDTIVMFAAPTGELDPTRAWMMAELLYLDGLERTLGSDEPVGFAAALGRDSLLKARALYDMVRPAGGMILGMPEAAERIEEIDRLLDEGGDARSPGRSVRRRRVWAGRRARAAEDPAA